MLAGVQDLARREAKAIADFLPRPACVHKVYSKVVIVEVHARCAQLRSHNRLVQFGITVVGEYCSGQSEGVAPQFNEHDIATFAIPVRDNFDASIFISRSLPPVG